MGEDVTIHFYISRWRGGGRVLFLITDEFRERGEKRSIIRGGGSKIKLVSVSVSNLVK